MPDLQGEAELTVARAFAPARLDSRRRKAPRHAPLESFVETEILPRLLRAHPAAPALRQSAADSVEPLVAALIAGESESIRAIFSQAAEAAGSDSRLMLDVLAPAARRLGSMWEQDSCDFFDVSQSLDRLTALLSGLRAGEQPARRAGPAMLLLTAPGETHAFGADMAAELFRREGWRVERGDASQLFRISQPKFAALGVSCACVRARDALPRFLAEARKAALLKKLPIVLGGALIAERPALACELGADFAAAEPDSARRVTRALLEPAHL